jgi:hypothetical protein
MSAAILDTGRRAIGLEVTGMHKTFGSLVALDDVSLRDLFMRFWERTARANRRS